MVANRAHDRRGGMVSRPDSGSTQERRYPHRQADHLQPCSCRYNRETGSAYASWAQIQKARQNPASDKSDQYTQPHKHTRAPQGGRRNPIRRLGNGHHHRLLRSCHRHPNRTFDQFHTHGKVASGTESPTDGPGGHPTAVPI